MFFNGLILYNNVFGNNISKNLVHEPFKTHLLFNCTFKMCDEKDRSLEGEIKKESEILGPQTVLNEFYFTLRPYNIFKYK